MPSIVQSFSIFLLATNIEGEQETELLAEYENQRKQQKPIQIGGRSSMNNLSPNKRRPVRKNSRKPLIILFSFRRKSRIVE